VSEAKVCPVCGGNGKVQGGFYDQVGGSWTGGDTQFETCRSCGGCGYVIIPSDQFVLEFPASGEEKEE
jgi:rRNA maturation protein Nop10